MPRYLVDVTALVGITVDADTAEGAAEEARAFVQALEPQFGFVDGWNSGRQEDEANKGRRVLREVGFDIEGDPEVFEGEPDDA
jgi:hypothetical protein